MGEPERLVLRKRRGKVLIRVLVGIPVVAIGLFLMLADTSTRYPDWFTRGVGAACLLMFGWMLLVHLGDLIRPPSLILTPEGFEVSWGLNRAAVAWSEIDRFFIYGPFGGRSVCYALKNPPPARSPLAWFNRRYGVDGVLPLDFGLDAHAMHDLMEGWRARYATA